MIHCASGKSGIFKDSAITFAVKVVPLLGGPITKKIMTILWCPGPDLNRHEVSFEGF